MALNFQNNKNALMQRVLLVVLLAVSIASTTLYVREGEEGPLHAMQAGFESLFSPLSSLGAQVSAVTGNIGTAAGDLTASPETLSALKAQNAELLEALTNAEEYRLEAERLRDALGLVDRYQIEGAVGRIVGRSGDAWNQTVTLAVGSDDGVQTGLTVMGTSGVIGQVVAVSPGTSTVRLLTDPQSGAAALIQSSRAEGIVRGSLDGLLYLENVNSDVVVNVGDVVLTSGLGGSYVRGLLIGTVVRVDGSASSGTRRIVVAPNDVVSMLEEAIVVFDATATIAEAPEDGGEGANGAGEGGDNATGDNTAGEDANGDDSGSQEGDPSSQQDETDYTEGEDYQGGEG